MKKLLLLILPLLFACSSDDDNKDDDTGDGVNILENTSWFENKEQGTIYFRFIDDKYCEREWYNVYDDEPTTTDKYKYSYNSKDKTVTIMNYSNHRLAIGIILNNSIKITLNKIDYILTKE